MRKYKKSTRLPMALFIYTTRMEKFVTIGVSYLIIALLWIVLRKQEKRREQERQNMENKK